MAQAVIGALRVNLGLNSAEFSKGLKKSENSLSDFGRKVGGAFKMVAGAAAAAGAAMTVALSGAAQEADKMIKASRALGEPVEDLSRLAHAAKLSGVEFAGLQTSLGRLSKNINDASIGIGVGARAFDELGINVQKADGSLKSSREILGEVSDQFEKMPDGAKKTALAMDLMGRSGASMISLLNGGRSSMEALGDEAEKLGLVFDQKTGEAAELFNDNLARLRLSMTGLWNRVLKDVIPVFAELTTRFSNAVLEGGRFDGLVNVLSKTMIGLARGIEFAFDHLGDLYDLFRIWITIRAIDFVATMAGSFITLARTMAVTGVSLKVLTSLTRAKITALLLLGAAVTKITGHYEQLESWVKQTAKAIEESLPDSLRSGIDDLGNSLEGLFGKITETNSETVDSFRDYLDFQNDAIRATKILGNSVQGVTGSTKSLVAEAQKLPDAWNGLRGEEIKAPARELEDAYSGVAGTVKSAFGSAFDDIRQGTFSVGDALKDLGLNLLNTFANNTIDSFFGSSVFGGGASTGGFNLASLGSFLSFDGGGKTPSGPRSGGLDGKGGFMAMLHPNETVIDETRHGMSGGGGVLEVRLGDGLEAAWLKKSEGVAVEVTKSAIQDYNRNQMPKEAMRAVQKGVKSGKSISA